METGVTIKRDATLFQKMMQGFKFLQEAEVFVGIPQEKDSRRGTISNAELLYIHTNGSPINHIPPRPVIEPALRDPDVRKQVQQQLGASMRKALIGNVNASEAEMAKAGMIAVAAIQKRFGSEELAPNAPITIHGGWMHNHVSGKLFYVKGKGSSAPLIDTGALRQSITWTIRRGWKR